MPLFSRGSHPEADDLREIELFAGLSDDELANIARLAIRREVDAGDILIDQGRVGDSFFLIAEGQALIYINDQFVTSVGPNSAVGETALVEHRPRNATVVAEGNMVVAEFGVKEFREAAVQAESSRFVGGHGFPSSIERVGSGIERTNRV